MYKKRNDPPDTALQKNHGFTAVDDYDTRMYILPHLVDREDREEIIAEHKAAPRGQSTQPGAPAPLQSNGLARLLDKLRMVPQAGKHTIIETKPWEEYTVGFLPGARGAAVQLSDEHYGTREAAEHAIFLKRLKTLLEQYGIEM
ncbi:MAG: hypothetical protein ACKVJI_11070 [Pseudomonadales bacterium]|jgi:hypothetical protein